MFKFNLYEVVRITRGGYSFDGCMGVVMGRYGDCIKTYAVIPLHPDALEVMHNQTIPSVDADSSFPPVTYCCFESELDKLRPYVVPEIPLNDEPEGVAPEIGPGMEAECDKQQDISKPNELTKLRKAYTLMRDMVDPAADDPGEEYLYCTRTAHGDPDCCNCPFAIPGKSGVNCGVVQIKVLLRGMRGRRDKSLR